MEMKLRGWLASQPGGRCPPCYPRHIDRHAWPWTGLGTARPHTNKNLGTPAHRTTQVQWPPLDGVDGDEVVCPGTPPHRTVGSMYTCRFSFLCFSLTSVVEKIATTYWSKSSAECYRTGSKHLDRKWEICTEAKIYVLKQMMDNTIKPSIILSSTEIYVLKQIAFTCVKN
jgi:hypothetical protein